MPQRPPEKTGLFSDAEPAKKQGLFGWLRGRFFAGMVIVAPLAATFWLLQFLITQIDKVVRPFLPPILLPETYIDYAIPGFGVLVMVAALTLLGAIMTNLVGRALLSAMDRFLSRIPLVKNIYAALKQLTDVLSNNQTASFDRVVLVQYPKENSWCIGFVSSHARGEIGHYLGKDKISVFVPTTPNPTSGFLVYVDPKDCVELDMSVEEGAKIILTAGLVVPDFQLEPELSGIVRASPPMAKPLSVASDSGLKKED